MALTDGARLVAQEQQGVAGTHSERLITSIDHLLSLAGWQIKDIEGVAVAIGPGSFTGLRIGIAAGKGIALANSIPAAGVSSLCSLAENGRGFEGAVASLIDARRGELYFALYKFGKTGAPKVIVRECAMAPEKVAAAIKRMRARTLLVGDGAVQYAEFFRKKLGSRAVMPAVSSQFACAANLAVLAEAKLKTGGDGDSLAPNYIRLSDAEIGFRGKAVTSDK